MTKSPIRMVPTSEHVLWGGAVEILCFGRRAGELQLRGATAAEAERNHPGILRRITRLIDDIESPLFAPHPNRFNAAIVSTQEMIKALDEEPGHEWAEGSLYRGPYADGVRLDRSDHAFAVWSADCPTAVLYDQRHGTVVAAHCGLKSFFEWEPGRPDVARHPVTHAMIGKLVEAAEKMGESWSPRDFRGFLTCGIGPDAFDFHSSHPEYARGDMARVHSWLKARWPTALLALNGQKEWLIDLPELFRRQIEGFGGPSLNSIGFDGVCTARDLGADGRPTWHSNRRDGADAGRNLVIVTRRR